VFYWIVSVPRFIFVTGTESDSDRFCTGLISIPGFIVLIGGRSGRPGRQQIWYGIAKSTDAEKCLAAGYGHLVTIVRRKTAHSRQSPRSGIPRSRFLFCPIYGILPTIMKYLTILRKTQYGYDVHAPALPGCHSQGDTEREALANIKDAIKTYLAMDAIVMKDAKVREVEVAFA